MLVALHLTSSIKHAYIFALNTLLFLLFSFSCLGLLHSLFHSTSLLAEVTQRIPHAQSL